MSAPRPAPAAFTSWSEACDALYGAFWRGGSGPGGWQLCGHDARACHFERSDGGPDFELLGIDWVDGALRAGDLYAPKQDGGYHTTVPLPEDWLVALRRLRLETWGESAPRFAEAADAGPALAALVDPVRSGWALGAWRALVGPGGPVDLLFVSVGHPLDLLVLALDRAAGTVAASQWDAEGAVAPLGTVPLPPALATDLAAIGWPSGFPAGAPQEPISVATLPAAGATAALSTPSAVSPEALTSYDVRPITAFAAAFGPTRWQMPGGEILWSGPSWHFIEGVPHSTAYGRFRATGGWVAIAFSPDFTTADFIEDALGPRPARPLGRSAVPEPWPERLAAIYRHR